MNALASRCFRRYTGDFRPLELSPHVRRPTDRGFGPVRSGGRLFWFWQSSSRGLFAAAPHSPGNAVLSFISHLWPRLMWRARIEGRVSIPEGQGAVIVCNHASAVDPWFVFLASDRLVAWMIAVEYTKMRSMSWS